MKSYRWLGIFALLALTAFILYRSSTTFFLLATSLFIAYLLDPLIDLLEKRKVPRTLGIFLVILAFSAVLTLLFLYLVPEIQHQTKQLASKAPSWGQWAYERLGPILDRFHVNVNRQELRNYAAELWNWVIHNIPTATRPILSIFRHMFNGIANFIVGILNIVIVPVMAFYILRDYDKIRLFFYRSLPPKWVPIVKDWAGELDKAVGGFLRGQLTIAVFLAIYYAIGLSLMGVPLGILLGVISGLANMVPYMSIFVGLVPSLLLSFIDQPSWARLLWVLLLFISGQLLEGLVLGPRVMSKETGLHPVVVMVAIMIGGNLMGLIGIILSVPGAAVVKVVLTRFYLRRLADSTKGLTPPNLEESGPNDENPPDSLKPGGPSSSGITGP